MRLAFICTEMLPSPAIRGGAIQVLIDGVVPYIKANHSLTIFGVSDSDLPPQEVRNGVEYLRFARQNYYQKVAAKLAQLEDKFDVIHVFNRPSNLPFYKAACPSARYVLSLHNEMFKAEKLFPVEGRYVISSVAKIVTVSNFIGGTITTRFPSAMEKVRTLYSGVDPTRFLPRWDSRVRSVRKVIRKQLGITDKKVILFVGRLSENKGPHLLIQALNSLKDRYKDLVVLIVGSKWFSDTGENDYITWLRRIAEPVKDQLIFTNWVPYEEIPKYFLAGDIFICTSQWQEPLARVHYEAMASGLPIITTNRGGNAEVIRGLDNGIVIDRYNQPLEFAKSIEYLLNNPNVAKTMGQRGRELVRSKFNFQRVADDLMQVYQQANDSAPTPIPNLQHIIQERTRRKNQK